MSARRTGENGGVGAVRGMFLFLLLAAFAVLSVIVVLVGVRVYRTVEDRGEQNYNSRTVLSYVAGKVRAADAEGRVTVGSVDGADALVLGADYGAEAYATYIYACDGQLMEYFGRADSTLLPEYGEIIAVASGFSASMDGKLLTVTVTGPDGKASGIRLYIQSGEAEA